MALNDAKRFFLTTHYAGGNGLRDLLGKTKSFTDQVPRKLRAMQSRYLQRTGSFYFQEQHALMEYYLDAFLYKEFSCDWLGEQIWGIVHTGAGEQPLKKVLLNSLDTQTTSDIETVALSLLLDNFLVQGAAFLDFYLLYLWTYFQQPSKGSGFLKWPDVEKMLRGTHTPPFDQKAQNVVDFLKNRVYTDQPGYGMLSVYDWGTVVNDLRHKVVHRDRGVPDFTKGQSLTEKITNAWPRELQEIGCARFCEDVRGDMLYMISTLAGMLYDEPWMPGLD